ncbi:MAG: CoA-binding protein, partial [archaeon]|nr:CoA-binding protein [archaeon]
MKRKLSFFFKPKSVACIGASETKGKVGFAVMSNIVDSFKGDIYPINKKRDTILGCKAFKSVLDIDASIDIAIICIPASFVIDTVKECAQKGIKGLVIISAGFKEVGGEGTIFEEKIQKIALENDIRIIGPNCLGIISPFLNASFATKTPKKGKIAMISQSGAMMTAILDWAEKEGIGFSNFVSIGNKTDLDEVDFIEDFAEDPETNTIILYIESVNNGMKFLQNVPKAARKKPIIILKSGISEAGSRAASSHTGALAGNDISFDIAFEKCGVIRAKTMTDLFDYAKCFNKVSLIPKGKQFAIITNAGGPGIITTDAFDTFNVGLSRFSSETIKELRKNLPKEASIYDPVDIIGDATPDRYKTALEIIFKEPETICAGA